MNRVKYVRVKEYKDPPHTINQVLPLKVGNVFSVRGSDVLRSGYLLHDNSFVVGQYFSTAWCPLATFEEMPEGWEPVGEPNERGFWENQPSADEVRAKIAELDYGEAEMRTLASMLGISGDMPPVLMGQGKTVLMNDPKPHEPARQLAPHIGEAISLLQNAGYSVKPSFPQPSFLESIPKVTHLLHETPEQYWDRVYSTKAKRLAEAGEEVKVPTQQTEAVSYATKQTLINLVSKLNEAPSPESMFNNITFSQSNKGSENMNLTQEQAEEITKLRLLAKLFLNKEKFEVGDIIKYKHFSLQDKRQLGSGLYIVVEVLPEPIYDDRDDAGSPYFRTPYDIIAGQFNDEDELVMHHFDSRRFTKVA